MQKRKLPSLVSVLILTLITSIMWVSFEVYRLFNKAATPSVPANVSAQIDPRLDQETINLLQNRLFLDDSEIPDSVVSNLTLPATTPAPSPLAEPETEEEVVDESSPEPEAENATGSGESI